MLIDNNSNPRLRILQNARQTEGVRAQDDGSETETDTYQITS